MDFEWNEDKNDQNIEKHGVDFADAALIFENWTLSREDTRKDYKETRIISLGMADSDCFVVVHTERKGVVRIISAWKGGRDEREQYQASIPQGAAREEKLG